MRFKLVETVVEKDTKKPENNDKKGLEVHKTDEEDKIIALQTTTDAKVIES